MSRTTLKILLPILVLVIGGGATAALVSSRKAPQKVERPSLGPLVEVEHATRSDVLVTVRGQGEVSPRVAVELAPQVGGRVIAAHPSLKSGGRFRAGTVLLEIDPRDYELAVERARAAVAGAETELLRQTAEAEAARAEWRQVHGDEEPPPLLVREPQLREAEARRAAAEADLAAAELALERTRLSLPWDGLVVAENADPGQLVMAGQAVATVYGTAAVEVRVPLDDRELAWLEGVAVGTSGGPQAELSADFGGRLHTWPGRVDRLEGKVDARSRMVHVVVRVDDPFATRGERPPLLPGTFVDVTIDGRLLRDVVAIPRHALRESALDGTDGGARDHVWVAADGKLLIRRVEVLRRERDRALVASGIEPGEAIVTSALDAVTDGMKVRVDGGGSGDA